MVEKFHHEIKNKNLQFKTRILKSKNWLKNNQPKLKKRGAKSGIKFSVQKKTCRE